ncbi:carboxymuconolactone decarboxylase family protein [Actinomadura madurae]|uniref:carboxymuconolactone decarboxylase family protein n=1 Tax=Actinomadura madurae TaxID=1993 RepID=UPI0032B06E07
MDARFNFYGGTIGAKYMKYIQSAGKVLMDSPLPVLTQHLVEIRASQINGCGVCLDMHTKDAMEAGRPRYASTWSRRGGRPRSSPKRSGPPWS